MPAPRKSSSSHKDKKRTKRDSRSERRSRSPHSHSSAGESDNEVYERRRKRAQAPTSREDRGDDRNVSDAPKHAASKESDRRDRKSRRDDSQSQSKKEKERRSATPEFKEATPETEAVEKQSLSIDETNKLRAKLGLKPLQVDGPDEKKGSTEASEVFVKTENLAHKKEAEQFREKLRTLRDKQAIKDKYAKIKSLAESDEDDDASKWVDKSKKLQDEKASAAQREKMLMEMEKDLGVEELVEKELKLKKEYTARDVKGLEILHNQERIKEGSTVVLTLKDQGVLDGGEDVLENVNLVDDEKAEKNIFNRKHGLTDYNPYDEADIDEFGIVHKKSLLSKYDEEIEGAKKDSFKIGSNKEEKKRKELEEIRTKLQKQKNTLVLPEPQIARDYMTGEEMAAFKKPKKVRKIRKREVLRADDLQPLEDVDMTADHGSRSRRERSDDGVVGPDSDLSKMKVEDDIPDKRLKARMRKAKRVVKEDELVQKLAHQVASIKEEPEEEVKGIAFNSSSIVLNSTAEFCRTLGSTSSYVARQVKPEEVEAEMEVDEDEPMDDSDEQKNTWAEVDPSSQPRRNRVTKTEPVEAPREVKPILEEEPDVTHGVAGALKLALKKGYIDDESQNNPAAMKKLKDIQAKNYLIEEKYYDEEGRGRRGGGGGSHYHGPVSDFKDKSGYKPEVKLEYIDDSGRLLSQKEAFRYLSHKFHGKGSGKNKIDKRQKKIEQLNKLETMSSIDTPLNTLKLLQEKQKQLQTPYIMLSGGAATALTGPSGLGKK